MDVITAKVLIAVAVCLGLSVWLYLNLKFIEMYLKARMRRLGIEDEGVITKRVRYPVRLKISLIFFVVSSIFYSIAIIFASR